MRRSEKIQRFLESHPHVTERDLQKKFQFSYREAQAVLASYHGKEEAVVRETSFWRGLFLDVGTLFSSTKKTVITLVSIALFWRLFYILFFAGNEVLQIPLLDAEYYLKWADDIVSQGWLGEKVFFTEPLYAYFLALLTTFFGRGSVELTALGIQFLLGALFPVALYSLGRMLFDERTGRIAGLIAALYGPFLFYEGLLLKTSFEVYSLPLFLLAFWRALEKPNKSLFVVSGLTLGLVVLIKGNAMVFLPVGCLLIFFFLREQVFTKKLLYSAFFVVGVLVCVLPITVRNYVVSHDIVPTNYSIGLVLYQGNWWGGDGSTARVPSFLRPHPRYEETDAIKMAESYEGRELKASEVSRFWMGKAVDEVFARPGHFLGSTGHKVLLLLNYRDYSDNYSYAYYRSQIPFLWILPGFFLVAIVGIGGVFLLFSRYYEEVFTGKLTAEKKEGKRQSLFRAKWMLVSFFMAYVGILLLTTINSRYRMPLVPFLILFSSVTIIFLLNRFYERTGKGVKTTLAVMCITAVLVVLPLSLFKHLSFADAYHNIGYWYFEKGEYLQAQKYFLKAVRDDDEYAWSYRGMFRIALLDGRYDDAKIHLQKLIAIRSDDISLYEDVALLKKVEKLPRAEAHSSAEESVTRGEVVYDADFYEATRWLDQGDDTKAEALLLQSLESQDKPIATLIALSNLKTKQNQNATAKEYLRLAIEKNPDLFVARYNLANIFIRENDYSQVGELLAPVYEFAPELGETWFNYTVTLIKGGKNEEALPIAEAYVERYKDDTTKRDKVAKLQEFIQAAKEQQKNNPLPNVAK